ncbi:hypothetical protein ACQ4PT_024236 [Festuca glaucescens]
MGAGGGSSVALQAEAEGAADEDPCTTAEGTAVEGQGAAAEHPSTSFVAVGAAALGADVGSMSAGFSHRDGTCSGCAASSAWPEGMDPNSSFCLIIRLLGNPKKARKDVSCFRFEKINDSDLTNYNDLVASIVEEYAPRYLEAAHL